MGSLLRAARMIDTRGFSVQVATMSPGAILRLVLVLMIPGARQ